MTNIPTTDNAGSMREAMKRALQQSRQSSPSSLKLLLNLLEEAQEALREDGYPDAVLELRQGLQTDYGLRYTAYSRNLPATFETPLFSIFVDDDKYAFQAEGELQTDLTTEDVITRARSYLLQPRVVDFITGLLLQFGKSTIQKAS